MFYFRIIDTEDGNQVIRRDLKTPLDSLPFVELIEYIDRRETSELLRAILPRHIVTPKRRCRKSPRKWSETSTKKLWT